MSQIVNNVTVFSLNEEAKKLLAAMNFETIPEEAKYLAFFEDGYVQFFETLDFSAPFIRGSEMVVVCYHTGVALEF